MLPDAAYTEEEDEDEEWSDEFDDDIYEVTPGITDNQCELNRTPHMHKLILSY